MSDSFSGIPRFPDINGMMEETMRSASCRDIWANGKPLEGISQISSKRRPRPPALAARARAPKVTPS